MTFDHREPGTAPAAWTTFLDTLTPEPVVLTGIDAVLVVAPHPDDETLGAGALIATAADAGLPVHVVLVSLGEGSHPDSPTTTASALATMRAAEFRAALAALHPDVTATTLGVPDVGLREQPDTLRDALTARLDATRGRTLLVAPWSGDGHRDHRVAGEVAQQVAAEDDGVTLLSYPVWAWHWDDAAAPTAPWSSARALPVDPAVLVRKRAALAAYRSQVLPLSPAPGDEAVVDERHAAHHLRTEEWFFAETPAASRSRESFDAHYDRKPEGWDFDGSWYERRKRAVTLAALPRERYRAALEVGCATGVLTAALTDRADAVLGTDIAAAPLARARTRAPRARFLQAAVPEEWPAGSWDLVVLSEIGYYLSQADLDRTIDHVLASLADDGVLVACHWRHPDDGAVSSGDAVDARLTERWPRPALVRHVEDDFVLSVLPGPSVTSVARAEGLAP
ncbi:bifunctional PIG-L family deacetylase/class I SAM-dependent methyltransferase [Curtobacterium sp. MCBA15_001]|uniref:bifunctional PIG-L family deacetylase/class I SAM-dependent methyltransferase n=1 Tax=Curtobacterium sp. MCBA15_001 TaxID=1898731 RepID=UPI0020C86403|nr:bifunctional PIG-L family deacetylase/class I SAM-dependent methyltransferase [Curtobacterium sp. MCBA15_001]